MASAANTEPRPANAATPQSGTTSHGEARATGAGGGAGASASPRSACSSPSSSDDDEVQALVFDIGSGMVKAGFAGDDAPRSVFPSITGKPRRYMVNRGAGVTSAKDTYIGDEAQQQRGKLDVSHPVERGVVSDWDAMEQIWHHTFYNELRTCPEERNVMLTETPLNPKVNREKASSIMFETFKVKGLFLQWQAVLALYASGRTTGCVLDSGDGVSHVVPIYEGYALPHAVKRMELAGRDMTERMAKALAGLGYSRDRVSSSYGCTEVARGVKEELCYVAKDYDAELKAFASDSSKVKEYEMPDGTKIKIGEAQIATPEALFRPKLVGLELPGLHRAAVSVIQECDIDIRKELYQNIVLSGGNTMFPGLQQRMAKEVGALVPDSMDVKVVAPPERKYSVWIGGSILAALSTFTTMWVTKEEFQEEGFRVLHRKCSVS